MVFGPFSGVFSTTKPLPDFVRQPVIVCSFGACPACRASTVRARAKAPDTTNVATIEPLIAPPASNAGSPGYYHSRPADIPTFEGTFLTVLADGVVAGGGREFRDRGRFARARALPEARNHSRFVRPRPRRTGERALQWADTVKTPGRSKKRVAAVRAATGQCWFASRPGSSPAVTSNRSSSPSPRQLSPRPARLPGSPASRSCPHGTRTHRSHSRATAA